MTGWKARPTVTTEGLYFLVAQALACVLLWRRPGLKPVPLNRDPISAGVAASAVKIGHSDDPHRTSPWSGGEIGFSSLRGRSQTHGQLPDRAGPTRTVPAWLSCLPNAGAQ